MAIGAAGNDLALHTGVVLVGEPGPATAKAQADDDAGREEDDQRDDENENDPASGNLHVLLVRLTDHMIHIIVIRC